jgi:hypothetical protein
MKSTMFYEKYEFGAIFLVPMPSSENCGLVSVGGLSGVALAGAVRV